jgi:hypothetical protein
MRRSPARKSRSARVTTDFHGRKLRRTAPSSESQIPRATFRQRSKTSHLFVEPAEMSPPVRNETVGSSAIPECPWPLLCWLLERSSQIPLSVEAGRGISNNWVTLSDVMAFRGTINSARSIQDG